MSFAVSPEQMSGSIKEAVKIIEPRMDIKADQEKLNVALRGCSVAKEEVYPSTSYSLQQATWAINTPSTNYVVDRILLTKFYVQFNFFAADGVTPVAPSLSTEDAPRAFPIHSTLQTLEVVLNGQSFSLNINEYIHALLRFNVLRKDRCLNYSYTPAYPDQYLNYNDWTNPLIGGSARNPFAAYGENSAEMSRGAYQPVTNLNIAPLNSTLQYEFTEALMISPLLPGREDDEGFINLNRFEVTLKFIPAINQMWSSNGLVSNIRNVTISFFQAPELHVRYLKPVESFIKPPMVTYPYYKPFQYTRSLITINPIPAAPGNYPVPYTTVQSDTIQLNQVPHKLYAFLRPSLNLSNAANSFIIPNIFTRIGGMELQWDNQILLSKATEQQLYEMGVHAGYNQSYVQWSYFTGSIICLEFGRSIGLSESEAPGSMGQHTLQISLRVANMGSTVTSYDMYLLPVYLGHVEISENYCRATIGNLTSQVVLNAKPSSYLDYRHYQMYQNLSGGNIFGTLKNIVNKIAKVGQVVGSVGKNIDPRLGLLENVSNTVARATGGRPAPKRRMRARGY